MNTKSFLLALSTITLAAPLQAQTTDAPPVNTTAVLTTLNQIKQKQQSDIKSTESTLAQTLMSTASDQEAAVAYYVNAIFATQFSGQNRQQTELQEWKKKHEQELRDPTFRSALCLHLMYLSLTISHDAGVKVKDLLPSLINYTQQIEANPALAGQEELMMTPLTKSLFVRSLEIGQYVANADSWEMIPVNVDGIFSKVILPEYRIEKNATGIFQYWDDRIQREETAATGTRRPLDADKFEKVTKPGLLWLRTEEYVDLGLKNTAINNMMQIIQANPYHPDAPAWIDEVEKLVKSIPPAAPASATTPPSAPATDPVVANPSTTQPAPN